MNLVWDLIGRLLEFGFACPFLGIFVGAGIFGVTEFANRISYVATFYLACGVALGCFGLTERLNDSLFVVLCILGVAGWPLGIFACSRRRHRPRRRNICTECGYDLRVPTHLCPECGSVNEEVRIDHVAEALRCVQQLPEPEAGEDADV